MPIRQLSLENLKLLDMGKVMEAFNLHIARVANDCMDRPADPKARTVTLSMDIIPVVQPDGSCDEVHAQFHVTSKVPTHRTRPYSCGLRRNGVLVFNEDGLDDVKNPTLMDDME